jgi:hypothetical protein
LWAGKELALATTHSFTFILAGVKDLTDEQVEDLFEAGCDDCTPSVRSSVVCLEFDREAESREEAIRSAAQDVQSLGFVIERIEAENQAT